jgi:DNA (cytosine-5)-methyltransferase 1
VTRPRLLDLFCGAGGAAVGYHRAGFDVVGVDIKPQPNYPFVFHQGDAMTWPLDGFDVIHASPPCQDHSSLHPRAHGTGWMLDATIERLAANGVPWVVENVEGPTVRMAGSWITLCGSMFPTTTHLRRHRRFGSSEMLLAPPCQHGWDRVWTITGHGGGKPSRHSLKPQRSDGPRLMDMSWATWDECVQAIPPAYTEYIGHQLLAHLGAAA